MNLRVAGIRKVRAAAMRAPDRGRVRRLGVRRKIEDVRIAARAEDDGVGCKRFDSAVDEIARDDALCLTVDDDEVEHLVAREHLHAAGGDLSLQGLERAEEELLSGLPTRIERARD